jgi:hypothetical protein
MPYRIEDSYMSMPADMFCKSRHVPSGNARVYGAAQGYESVRMGTESGATNHDQ